MKKTSTTLRLLIVAGLLQSCAGVVKHEGSSTRKVLEGSKQLSMSSKQCPRGMGIIRLYRDTLDGNKIKYNAKLALTSAAITSEFNIYNLLDENNKALLQKGEKGLAKAEIDTKRNTIMIKLSDEGANNVKKSAATDPTVKMNEDIAINFNSKVGYYTNWGTVEDAAISDVAADGRKIVKSVAIKLDGKTDTKIALPDPVDNDSVPLDEKLSGEVGKALAIKIAGKVTDKEPGMIYVQLTNGKDGKENITYNYIVDDAGAEINVPTKEIKPDSYVMTIFRSEVVPINVAEAGKPAENFCMEIGTGVMGRAAVAAPAKK